MERSKAVALASGNAQAIQAWVRKRLVLEWVRTQLAMCPLVRSLHQQIRGNTGLVDDVRRRDLQRARFIEQSLAAGKRWHEAESNG